MKNFSYLLIVLILGVFSLSSCQGYNNMVEKQEAVTAGDMLFLADGHSHGLQNTGKEPLVFIGIVAD